MLEWHINHLQGIYTKQIQPANFKEKEKCLNVPAE